MCPDSLVLQGVMVYQEQEDCPECLVPRGILEKTESRVELVLLERRDTRVARVIWGHLEVRVQEEAEERLVPLVLPEKKVHQE